MSSANNQAVNPNAIDILFIHADSFYGVGMSMFSIGTLYVATACEQHGYKVKCLGTPELFSMEMRMLRLCLMNWAPKIVGFYAVIDNIHNVQRYATQIKKWFPHILTIVGGPMASTNPRELAQYPAFDCIVPGEGELVTVQLADALLRDKGSLDDVPSIVFRRGDEIVAHPMAPVIEDLDTLPFPNHDLVGMTHGQHISTGRGCPYQCAFCFKEDYNHRFRCRSAENIAAEIIKRAEKHPVTNVYITDDVFAVAPERVLKFCEIISEWRQKNKRKFVFFCEGRAEVLARHPEMMEALVEAGMVRLQIGIESGNQQMLKDYGKNLKLEHVLTAVRQAYKLRKLTIAGNFIIGGPHENEATVAQSLEFAKTLLHEAPTVFECTTSALSALPGTKISLNPEHYGIKVLDTEFLKGMTLSDAYCETEFLSRARIRELRENFDKEVLKTMNSLLKKASFNDVMRHTVWAQRWHLQTFYYSNFIANNELLQSYFQFQSSPRFRRLEMIPHLELANYVPMRTLPSLCYTPDGQRIRLGSFFGKRPLLKDPMEKLVFEYSSSKLSIGQIAERINAEMHLEQPTFKTIVQILLPIYQKLEDMYQVVFYR